MVNNTAQTHHVEDTVSMTCGAERHTIADALIDSTRRRRTLARCIESEVVRLSPMYDAEIGTSSGRSAVVGVARSDAHVDNVPRVGRIVGNFACNAEGV